MFLNWGPRRTGSLYPMTTIETCVKFRSTRKWLKNGCWCIRLFTIISCLLMIHWVEKVHLWTIFWGESQSSGTRCKSVFRATNYISTSLVTEKDQKLLRSFLRHVLMEKSARMGISASIIILKEEINRKSQSRKLLRNVQSSSFKKSSQEVTLEDHSNAIHPAKISPAIMKLSSNSERHIAYP